MLGVAAHFVATLARVFSIGQSSHELVFERVTLGAKLIKLVFFRERLGELFGHFVQLGLLDIIQEIVFSAICHVVTYEGA